MRTFLDRVTHASLGAVLLCAALPALGQSQAPVLLDRPALLYPREMYMKGVREGAVRVQIDIDAQGAVADWLAIETSHEGFVDALDESHYLEKWRFEPATEDGVACPSSLVVRLDFKGDDVMTLSSAENAVLYMSNGRSTDLKPRVFGLSKLDTLPKAIETVQPPVAGLPADALYGEAIVTFYIDQEGKARLPLVSKLECDPRAAAAAVAALQEWKFEPPMRKGKPVIARAVQRFVFAPPSEQ